MLAISVTFQSLGTLEIVLQDFKNNLNRLQNDSELRPLNPQLNVIEPAFDVVELTEFIDEFMGPFILIEYALSFVVEVIGAFFGVLVTTAFTSEGINLVILTSCTGSSILGLAAFWKMWLLASKGQKLCSLFEDILTHFNKIYSQHYKCFNAKDKCDMGILLDRYSVTAPIRPLEVFHMNRSSLLAANSLIFTYIFVLMQFRIGS